MKPFYLLVGIAITAACSTNSTSTIGPGTGAGVGGSTARFTISANTLYILSNNDLKVYDIRDNLNPKSTASLAVGTGVETLFPYGETLFIGTQTGMLLYDISQPNRPQQVGMYSHIQSCDPVVAQGNYAYVTLRSGTPCRNAAALNSLDVIDISNRSAPRLIKSYPMTHPHGLGADGHLLFVGEGDQGLRVMDISDPANVRQLQYFENTRTYDVIPYQKRLVVTGPDGVYQYSYADGAALQLLSKLPIE